MEKNWAELMRIYGDFTIHDYQFEVIGALVASFYKKWVALRDQIGLSITCEVDKRLIIAAVIVIEHLEANERQNQH